MSTRTSTMKWMGLLTMAAVLGCGGRSDRPPATTSGTSPATTRPPTTAPRPEPPTAMPAVEEDRSEDISSFADPYDITGRTLDEINADNPLDDIRFDFDSAVLQPEARSTLESHAEWLERYPSVTLVVEGHCDERGTVEYNLALGERRAMAAYNYLVSLGIAPGRLRTISYGKEFPLDPGHDEEAWARNRRAHFEFTGK